MIAVTGLGQNARALLARNLRKAVAALVATTMLFTVPCVSRASVNSNRVDVTLQASVLDTLTLLVTNPVVAFGTVTPGAVNAAPAGQAISITTAWVLTAGETVKLYAYFDSAASALTGTTLGDLVPTSSVTAHFNSGSAQTFTQASPFTAGSTALQLYSIPVTAANAVVNARVDSLALSLNLSGVTIRPDTYTGVMHLQAQVL